MLEESPETNSINELAAEYGWNPEGEKSASEYVKLALEKFPEQSKKIKQLFKAVDEMKDHMTKTEKIAYERAKADLDAERRQAIKEGNVDKVERLDKAKEELLPQMSQPQSGVDPSIQEFEERNSAWLNGTSYEELEMQQWVESHGAMLGRKKLPVDEHMALLEDHLKKKFPDYFEGEGATEKLFSPVSAPSNGAQTKRKSKTPTFNDLSLEQKQSCTRFKELGIMTVEQYIKDLVDNGDL